MDDFVSAREKMVDSQVRTEDVTDYGILAAMGEIPRERFVPSHLRPFAYIDEDLLLNQPAPGVPPRYLMRPAPFARLVQLAEIDASESVLDIGCATGYSTAVLARLAASVVAVESDDAFAVAARSALLDLGVTNARVVVGPLEAGDPPSQPYDVIILGGAVEIVPDLLFAQLGDERPVGSRCRLRPRRAGGALHQDRRRHRQAARLRCLYSPAARLPQAEGLCFLGASLDRLLLHLRR